MDRPEPKLSVSSTIELVIAAPSGGNPTSKVSLNVAEVDELITRLCQYRAAMAPEIPRAVPESVCVGKSVMNPMWIVHKPTGAPFRLLVVRHPGLGWMLFQLPVTEADKLGHALLAEEKTENEALPARHAPLH